MHSYYFISTRYFYIGSCYIYLQKLYYDNDYDIFQYENYVKFDTLSEMRFHYELFCNMNYKRRIQVR